MALTAAAGQRVTYRAYTMTYSRTLTDGTGCVERERHGTVTSVQPRFIRVQDDAGGIVSVPYHRIVRTY